MRAGLLNRQIRILRKRSGASGFGGMVSEYEVLKTTKARVIHRAGSVGVNAVEEFASLSVLFEIHLYQGLVYSDRIEYDGSIYRITDIDRNPTLRKVIISAERIND